MNNAETATQYYYKYISPALPDKVLDFHAHIWKKDHWFGAPNGTSGNESSTGLSAFPTAKYMSIAQEYSAEMLSADGQKAFPEKKYYAVCFGLPTPAGNVIKSNAYVAESAAENPRFFPLLIAGGGILSPEEITSQLKENGFYGYKVYLNWIGNDYGSITVEDMVNSVEMEIANALKLVIMLHVPRSDRLADPAVQKGVARLARACPNASIVLAHCGRCYHPLEMHREITAVADLPNVYMDTSMVMEPIAIEMAMRALGPQRLLFATDFPVAAMIGKRVNIMDHWVDVVAPGYSDSEFRVPTENIRAMIMAQECALSVIEAAYGAGISGSQLKGIFWDNGIKLLDRVNGKEIPGMMNKWLG